MEVPIELHGDRTGNCVRVAIALEEAGLPYVVSRVDLSRGEQREARHLHLNPAGKVPTIVDRSCEPLLVLSQSNAILLYLAKRSGSLLPWGNPALKALACERFFYFLTDVIAPSHAAFQLRSLGRDGESARALQERSLMALAAAERYLSEAEYMSGPEFGLADIAAVTIALASADSLDWSQTPRLRRWYEKNLRRSAVQRGLHAFDPPI
jgi:GST-like protein